MRRLAKSIALVAIAACGISLVHAADPPAKVKVEIRRAESKPAEGLVEAVVQGTDKKVYLHKSVDLTNEDIASGRVVDSKETGPSIEITFTKEGQKQAAKVSEAHQAQAFFQGITMQSEVYGLAFAF